MLFVERRSTLIKGTIEEFTAFVLFSCSIVKIMSTHVVSDMTLLIKTWHNHAGMYSFATYFVFDD